MTASDLRAEILRGVARYHEVAFPKRGFLPGETPVPCAGRTFDSDELTHLVDSALDFWLTSGRYAARFEQELARFVGTRHAMLCNSGSSANLLAVAALTSPKLGDRRLQPGDEVITAAAAFPTTVFPIVQHGTRAGLCGCRSGNLQRESRSNRGGHYASDSGHPIGPHPGKSI